jgi:hypothetical protein
VPTKTDCIVDDLMLIVTLHYYREGDKTKFDAFVRICHMYVDKMNMNCNCTVNLDVIQNR